MSAPRGKTREERLFAAAVLRRTFELAAPEHRAGFTFVYEGVLRDLDLGEEEVRAYLAEHRAAIDAAVQRDRGGA